jgi:hypothetical protein
MAIVTPEYCSGGNDCFDAFSFVPFVNLDEVQEEINKRADNKR